MVSISAKAIGSRLKSFAANVAKQIASVLASQSGQGTLPTRRQLEKVGPHVEFTRGSWHKQGW
jgi:hypothetical protein